MKLVIENSKSFKIYEDLVDNVCMGAKDLGEAKLAKEALDSVFSLGINTALETIKNNRIKKIKRLGLFVLAAGLTYKYIEYSKKRKEEVK